MSGVDVDENFIEMGEKLSREAKQLRLLASRGES
jgi:hypothetical protein